MSNILALDLAQSMGFALGRPGAMVSGVWNFKPKKNDDWVDQFVNFEDQLRDHRSDFHFKTIVYERVNFHSSVQAAHVHAGYKVSMLRFAKLRYLNVVDFTPSQWRKIVLGKGGAKKQEAIDYCLAKGIEPTTHDEAEAVCIFDAYWKSKT